jgi:hypothetical protein
MPIGTVNARRRRCEGQCGAVTLIQRCSALSLNVPFHMLISDMVIDDLIK